MKKETQKNQDILFVLLYLLTLAAFITACVLIIKETNVRVEYMKTTVAELRQQVEAADEEYRELHQQQVELIEENARLRERLEQYENLSSYIKSNFKKTNPSITEEEVDRLTALFWELTRKYDFDPWQVASWIMKESEYKITAISHAGAVGLTQVIPRTGEQVAGWLGIKWEGQKTLLDPENNMRIGFYHLAWGRENSINIHQMYTMYFWGYGNTKERNLVETNYSKDILTRAEQLRRMQNVEIS